MFYYFKNKHKLLEGKLEFKEYNYKFTSYEMELYSAHSTKPISTQGIISLGLFVHCIK